MTAAQKIVYFIEVLETNENNFVNPETNAQ
jgi:hypothetical protein